MFRKITPNRALVYGFDLLVAFWVAAYFIPVEYLRTVFNSLAFGCSVVIVLSWRRAAWEAVKHGASSGEWQLILGIWLGWLVLMAQRAYSMLFNYMDQPVAWLNWPLSAFWPFAYTVCGFLFLAAPGVTSQEGLLRRKTYGYLLGAAIVGAFVAGVLLGASIAPE